jgi:hypothetical protein
MVLNGAVVGMVMTDVCYCYGIDCGVLVGW